MWKIGDRAKVIRPGSVMFGMEVVITQGLHRYCRAGTNISIIGYGVDAGLVNPAGFLYACQEKYLIPIDDGRELTTSLADFYRILEWQPKEVA